MNLAKLFDMQRVLDERIEKEHPPVEGEDRLAKKILALQVELGECANEWRGFKFWSNKQTPSIRVNNPIEHGNPLLEEYVDCLHFILSIGLEMKIENADLHVVNEFVINGDINKTFSELIALPTDIKFALDINDFGYHVSYFEEILSTFIELGKLLDLTWEQIEQAYISKNEVNHERQSNGY